MPETAGSAAGAERRSGIVGRLLSRIGGDALERRLARGAVLAFVINILSILVAMLAQAVLARSLGVEGYGVVAYVVGWVNLLVVPAMVGLRVSQLRYVASYLTTQDWALMRGVSAFADQVVIGAGIGGCLSGLLVVWLLSDRLDPVLARTFYVGLPMVPVLALMRTRAATIRALGAVVAALVPDNVTRQLTLMIGVAGLALLLPAALRPETAMLVALAAAVLSLVLVSRSRARMWPAPARAAAPGWRRRAWLVTTMPLLLYSTIRIVNDQAGLLLLGWLGDTTEAGIYAIASRLGGFVAFPLLIMSFVFAPTIARLHTESDEVTLQRTAITTGWWVTTATLVIALPLAAFAEAFLALFGEAFVGGATALRILLVGAMVNALTGPVAQLLNMTGLERQASGLIIVATILNVVLNLLLIPLLGTTGAAIAGAVAASFLNLAAVVVVWQRRRILAGVFGALRR